MLLLHGLGGTLDDWDRLELDGRGSVAMDLRGHGLSGEGPWEWERVLDDVEAVVRHLDLGSPAVVGHSLGGMLAVQWALRHPECPARCAAPGGGSLHAGVPRHDSSVAWARLPPHVQVTELDAGHDMLTAQPTAVRDLIAAAL